MYGHIRQRALVWLYCEVCPLWVSVVLLSLSSRPIQPFGRYRSVCAKEGNSKTLVMATAKLRVMWEAAQRVFTYSFSKHCSIVAVARIGFQCVPWRSEH